MRQPPPGLRPSRRSTTGGRGVPLVQVPPPPPMDFTPAPELVSETTTPASDLVSTAPSMPAVPVATPPRKEAPAASPPRIFTPPRASTPPPAAGFPTPPPGAGFPTPPPAAGFPTPPPAAGFPTPPPGFAPGPADIPDLTDEIDPQPAPAVWKQGHPSARKWAERRRGGAVVTSKRAPSLPRVVLGILVAALGAWLVLSFLPDRKPLTAAERARVEKQAGIDADAWRFGTTGYMAARGGAALYITIGSLIALRGLLYRRRLETPCRRCGRTVLAERSGLSLRCDSGQHAAGVNASALALVVAFALLSLALAALIAAASLG